MGRTVYLVERVLVGANGTIITETSAVFDDKDVALRAKADRDAAVRGMLGIPVPFPRGPAVPLGQLLSDIGVKAVDHRVLEVEVKGGDLTAPAPKRIILTS